MPTSIIIATHARPAPLARLLESLKPQIDPARHQILIADNGTAEPALIPDAIGPVVHIHDPQPGKCRVQNRAIAEARGEIIVCLDDDLTVAPCYVAAVERFFADHPEFAAMKGRVIPAANADAAAGANARYLDLPIVDHGEHVIEVRGVLGANMAFRASALAKVGLFDERLGPGAAGHEEETEMSARLRRAGFRIGYAPEALVYHDVDPSRADRARFIRIARERGRCRMIHERHSLITLTVAQVTAALRLFVARLLNASPNRIAREEKRLAIAQGMLDGARGARR
ncbi:MAG: glycosyltransferase [Candidatus Binataceae bacterium]|jgi:GT2 family glycosyltransferase